MPDTLAELEIEPLKKTLARVKPEALVDALTETLEEKKVETLTLRNTMVEF